MSRRARIVSTQLALLLIAASLCVVGRGSETWPLVLWEMYSARLDQFPEDTTESVQLRVRFDDGEQRVLFPWDFLAPEQQWFAEVAAEYGFDPEKETRSARYQTYLWRAAERAVARRDLDRIEVWRVTWAVRPLERPPLDLARPLDERRVGTFGPPRVGEGSELR